MKLIIEMQDEENYAAHNGFTGEYRWKYKIGTTYVVNNIDLGTSGYLDDDTSYATAGLVEELKPFIETDDNHYKSYIATWYILKDDADTEYVKNQKEQDPNGWDTLYVPTELKKNSQGVWFQKRGYIAGNRVKDDPKFSHLAGKFIGWVDNLITQTCILQIEGDARTPITPKEFPNT
tara:strand:- start:1813 stop:2343 length:531 start_codon:yes stop_codon:yes gene_type:complete